MKKVIFYALCSLGVLFLSADMNALLRPTKEMAQVRARVLQYRKSPSFQKKKIAEKVKKLKPDEYFIYTEGTVNGVILDKDILMHSKVIKSMLEDIQGMGENFPRAIPIKYSTEALKESTDLKDLCHDINLISQKVSQFSLEQLVGCTNVLHELHFSFGATCDKIIDQAIGTQIVYRIKKFMEECLSIGLYVLCDIKDVSKYSSEYTIACDSKIDANERFDQFCNNNNYMALKSLNNTVGQAVLLRLSQQSHFLSPMNQLIAVWPDIYNRLTTIKNSADFLDLIKNTVATEIKNRQYREKPWFWQKWF